MTKSFTLYFKLTQNDPFNNIIKLARSLPYQVFSKDADKLSMKKIKEVLFMTDLETTGVDPKETEILEIASVAVDFDGFSMTPIKDFHRFIHTKTEANPNDEFVVKHQSELYKKCNSLPESQNLERVRSEFKDFINEFCPKQDPLKVYTLPQFCGQNFSIFDAPYLVHNDFLKAGHKDSNGKIFSYFNYRSLELQTFSIVFAKRFGFKTVGEFMSHVASLDKKTILPEGNAHTALYDCYNQIKFFNGMMSLFGSVQLPTTLPKIAG